MLAEFAFGLSVDDLYVAEVLVTNETQDQLAKGAEAGLLQVLVRVSGTREVEKSAMITRDLHKPEAYYYQYSYESTTKSFQIGEESVPAKLLRIHFEPAAVARLLRRAGFPVWGSNRPGVLLWLALNDADGRRIISGTDASEIAVALRDQARLRGLPLLFPLLDLEDSASLSTAEVWGVFLGRIDEASMRYNPDSVLTGRIQKDTVGRWSANWSYRLEGDWHQIESVAYSVDEMVRTMVDKLANQLAAKYAIDSSRSQVMLNVESVDTIEDYAELSSYLESLAPVLGSFVVSVHEDVVEFRLSTEGQNEQLVEVIKLDEKMLLLNADNNRERLHYRWMR